MLKVDEGVPALYNMHLVLEKLAKALWVRYNEENIPLRIHNINYLLSQTPLVLS